MRLSLQNLLNQLRNIVFGDVKSKNKISSYYVEFRQYYFLSLTFILALFITISAISDFVSLDVIVKAPQGFLLIMSLILVTLYTIGRFYYHRYLDITLFVVCISAIYWLFISFPYEVSFLNFIVLATLFAIVFFSRKGMALIYFLQLGGMLLLLFFDPFERLNETNVFFNQIVFISFFFVFAILFDSYKNRLMQLNIARIQESN